MKDDTRRKGRNIIPDSVWNWIYDEYDSGKRLQTIHEALPQNMRFGTYKAFETGFYLRRVSLRARAEQRRACRHEWKPLGFTLDADGGLRPTDHCKCGATQYANV